MRESTFQSLWFRILPLAVMLAAAVAGLVAGPAWSERLDALPWVVSLVFVGLAHGAADLAVTRRISRGSAGRVFALYIAGMAAVFLLFMAAPVPMIVLFAALSTWHFGMGHADGQSPAIAAGVVPQARAAVARGAMVLGVPLLTKPTETAAVVLRLVKLVGTRGQLLQAEQIFSLRTIHDVGFLLVAAGTVAFAAEVWTTRRAPGGMRRSLDTMLDLAVIALLGAATSPLFSVGLYFLAWHAWRHTRLLAPLVVGVEPHDNATLLHAIVRLHLAALPLLVPTWAAIGTAWWWLSPEHSARDLAILSLAAYLVVTPSHDMLIDLVRSRSDTVREPAPETPAIPPSCAARIACSSS